VISEFSVKLVSVQVDSCEGDLSSVLSVLHIREDLSQPERHCCKESVIKKAGKVDC